MKNKGYVIAGLYIMLGLMGVSCINKNPEAQVADNEVSGSTTILFDTLSHHFGSLIQGEIVSYTFRFKNTGARPLVIKDAKAGCGCTVPAWPEEPVKPGEKAGVEVRFNSAGRSGNQYKTVKVTANTKKAEHVLVIAAHIE